MKLQSHLLLHFALLLLPIIGSAESVTFPEVGKRYYLHYANPDENPTFSKMPVEGMSRGTVTVLQNAGNGWAEVEFVGAVFDTTKQAYVPQKIRIWLNFARVTSAREMKE